MEERITVEENLIRLDKYLAMKNPEIPREFFKDGIKEGKILVNGKKVQPSYKVKEGDEIEINCQYEPVEIEVEADERIKFEILFKNDDFAVIKKPSGISVHPSLGEKSRTLVNGLLAKYPQVEGVGEDRLRPGIVHRLDKETSGLMIVVLNQKSFEYFKEAFKNREVRKKYMALAWDHFSQRKGRIESFIGKSKSNPIKQSTSRDETKVINPKKAVTKFKVIKEYGKATLVEMEPKTGRMHQIRIHLHSIGHPIVGDRKYESKMLKPKNRKFKRFFLHASELFFKDQYDKEYHFQSETPEEFEKATHSLDQK